MNIWVVFMAKKLNLPLAAMERLLRNAGAERVSKKAAELFAEVLENTASRIGEEAVLLAKHSGRKTVNAEDIKLAHKRR